MTHQFISNSKYHWLIVGLFILIKMNLSGQENCFAIQAEYIYFKPCVNTDFIAVPNINGATPFNLQPGGPGKKNKFDYSSGFRLHAFYFNPNVCSLIQNGYLSFTYLPAHHVKKVRLASFFSVLAVSDDVDNTHPSDIEGFITSDHRLRYYGADACITVSVFDIDCLHFSVQPGLHYACMNYHSDVSINDAFLKEMSETWGVGPALGFNLNYAFNNRLMIKGEMKGGLLLSRAKARFQMDRFESIENASDSFLVNPRSLWKVFPFWKTNLSLSTFFLVHGYPLNIEIGYEYLTYPNFINRIQFPGNGSSNRADNLFSNFDFQGPYVSLMISF